LDRAGSKPFRYLLLYRCRLTVFVLVLQLSLRHSLRDTPCYGLPHRLLDTAQQGGFSSSKESTEAIPPNLGLAIKCEPRI
jgi:hypothetical protein